MVAELLDLLKDSLHAVYVPNEGAGLVQILPDLRREGYRDLRPEEQLLSLEQWKDAWDAFVDVVKFTLIPLANHWVVHVDLRPGHDRTANLLFRGGPAKKMVIIDLDSLVDFSEWRSLNHRLKHDDGLPCISDIASIKKPLEFVYWQVAAVAYSWINKKTSDLVTVNFIAAEWRGRVAGRECNEAFIFDEMDWFWSELSSRDHVTSTSRTRSDGGGSW
jgi:hypothetical protein